MMTIYPYNLIGLVIMFVNVPKFMSKLKPHGFVIEIELHLLVFRRGGFACFAMPSLRLAPNRLMSYFNNCWKVRV